MPVGASVRTSTYYACLMSARSRSGSPHDDLHRTSNWRAKRAVLRSPRRHIYIDISVRRAPVYKLCTSYRSRGLAPSRLSLLRAIIPRMTFDPAEKSGGRLGPLFSTGSKVIRGIIARRRESLGTRLGSPSLRANVKPAHWKFKGMEVYSGQ